MGKESPYLPGQGPYEATPFSDNQLTHSPLRYRLFRETYRDYPEVQLGGPSARWLDESITQSAQAAIDAGRIRSPLLLLQAGGDQVVRADAQQAFCKNMAIAGNPCAGKQPLVIPGARHELLHESDEFRFVITSYSIHYTKLYDRRQQLCTWRDQPRVGEQVTV